MSADPFYTHGTPELCTWRVGPNLCRFQTTSPDFARKLAKRENARLVGWGVNRFLRIFQEPMPPRRGMRLVERYLTAARNKERLNEHRERRE
jgi:hypothetical protein